MKQILHMNNLFWDINSNEAKLNSKIYYKGYKKDTNYFEFGRHAIFLSNSGEKYGYKFFIVKGICYDLFKITELFNIHMKMFSAGFGVNVYGICTCFYNNKLHYGIQVEKLSKNTINKNIKFPINDFKIFCRTVNGLIKREYYYEELYGREWYKNFPDLEFNVGDNNIMYDNIGNPKIIDIDPRWQIKK